MLLVKKQRHRDRNIIIIIVMNSRVASDTFPAETLFTENNKKKKEKEEEYSNGW